jgi:hypothetical protein
MNPLQVPQKGPYGEGGLLTGNFAYLSKTSTYRFPSKGALLEAPSMEPLERAVPHLQSPFIHLTKSPVDEPSYRFPKRSPYEKICLSPEPFLNILQGSQQGSPPSRCPSQSSHGERHSFSRAPFSHISKSL